MMYKFRVYSRNLPVVGFVDLGVYVPPVFNSKFYKIKTIFGFKYESLYLKHVPFL